MAALEAWGPFGGNNEPIFDRGPRVGASPRKGQTYALNRRCDSECKGKRRVLKSQRYAGPVPADLTFRLQTVEDEISLQEHRKEADLGEYPRVSLRDARKQRDVARDMLAEGKDPSARKARRASACDQHVHHNRPGILQQAARDGDRAWAPATATRTLQLASATFRYPVVTARLKSDKICCRSNWAGDSIPFLTCLRTGL
ncbi:Arm DNA-binding domain-containing protein [Novosphingobium sp. BL-52-GroH]|uniref:Arm DNA-binding domain-containing protein n=1 Tax=Novosphingobium sp. BL-52-GroH TaxID=3349877 RepID=UPI00384E1944